MRRTAVFKTGLEGDILPRDNLRAAERYLPDNIYGAVDYFNNAEWTTSCLEKM
jgi:glutamine synthetase